jgi:aminoglycoside 2'-N-acetyltransferase I
VWEVQRLEGPAVTEAFLAELRVLLWVEFDEFVETDWEHGLGGVHFAVVDDGRLLAHAAVVPRWVDVGGRAYRTGYVENVATAAQARGSGLATLAMSAANTWITDAYEFGALVTGSHGFYRRLGWESWEGATFVRRGADRVPSPDEDDALMVLRFGASADVDLRADIACDERPGDDW